MLVAVAEINTEELDYFINELSKHFTLSNNYERTINLLENMFNITVTLEQLEEYYGPNASEIEEDLKLQFKHLGLV